MKLLKVTENEFILLNGSKTRYVSSLESLAVRAAHSGIKFDELEIALIEMVNNDHNFAEFGDLKKAFLYTGKI